MLLFPSAVDVLDANSKYIIKSESDGKVIDEGRDDLCKNEDFKELCRLPQTVSRVYEWSEWKSNPSFKIDKTVNAMAIKQGPI